MPCVICDDTGYKKIAISGKADRVARCECRLVGRNDRLFEQASIPDRYRRCSIASFEPGYSKAPPSLAAAKITAQRFVEQYPLDRAGILMLGPIGVGKTHLACGIIADLTQKKGIKCLFRDYRELLSEIRNSYNDRTQASELELLSAVYEVDVLLLDELGAVKPTEWVMDTVSILLNRRYNSNLTTIITTNFADKPPGASRGEETLGDRIGERMRSRLHEMCRILPMDGIDFRQHARSVSRKESSLCS